MSVSFHFLVPISLTQRTRLKKYLPLLALKEGRAMESLTIIFVSDGRLLEINRQFLNHDYYTDIITFDLSSSKSDPIQGEIYISTDRVRDNADRFGTTIRHELHRVMFHGLLHLCGYGDKTANQEKEMRKMEDRYLKEYFGSTTRNRST